MLYTTLRKIRSHHPCEASWKKLLRYLGKTEADDKRLALSTILKSNGLDDARWALIDADYDAYIEFLRWLYMSRPFPSAQDQTRKFLSIVNGKRKAGKK